MQLNIRGTTKDDLSAILDIYNDEILNGTATFHTIPQTIAERVQWLANTQGKQYPCMVAEVMDEMTGGNRIVAYCNLWHYKERPAYDGTAELSLYVHKDFRGRGIGERLLDRTLEEARKQGDRFHTIIAGVTTENTRTTKFWAEHGFELKGTLKEVGRKFGRWLDVSYYQLVL
ncbi:GCN5-related N-acetyltransferase [Earliella scabrosa]|nr:GCN5-related N-acetyltransferase [Earliella scabrosa]